MDRPRRLSADDRRALADFVLARVDDDERHVLKHGGTRRCQPRGALQQESYTKLVLRDCAAVRALVAEWQTPPPVFAEDFERVMRALAKADRNHPDFDPAWL